jgi:hypothetical protein
MPKKVSTLPEHAPQRISLQVPKNVNLVEMSNEEIEALALEMSRKAVSELPRDTAVLGVDRVTLATSAKPEIGVWGEWSRACARAELRRDIVVNPEVFQDPLQNVTAPSVKSVIQNKGSVKSTRTKKGA